MKIVILILTMLVQFLAILKLKFLDNFNLVIVLFLISLGIGCILRFIDKQKNLVYQVGWGIFYGSLISVSAAALFTIWLSANFPR